MTTATKVASHSTVIIAAMIDHMAVFTEVATLKWLVAPTAAAPAMTANSTNRATAMTVPNAEASRRPRCS